MHTYLNQPTAVNHYHHRIPSLGDLLAWVLIVAVNVGIVLCGLVYIAGFTWEELIPHSVYAFVTGEIDYGNSAYMPTTDNYQPTDSTHRGKMNDILRAANEVGISPQLLYAVGGHESGGTFDTDIRGGSGERSPFQIMPGTFEGYCSDMGSFIDLSSDFYLGAKCSATILKDLDGRFGDIDSILRGYNAGTGGAIACYPDCIDAANSNGNYYRGVMYYYEVNWNLLLDSWLIYPGTVRHENAVDLTTTSDNLTLRSPFSGVVVQMGYDNYIGPLSYDLDENGKQFVPEKNQTGNTFIVISGEDYRIKVLHLCFDDDIKEGDFIAKGESIGTMCDIGNSSAPHAHVQVSKIGGGYVFPY